MDELVSAVAKEIHYYFNIDAISVVLRSNRNGKLNIYSTHYIDVNDPVHDQSEVNESGTLTERVFKSKEMLMLNLNEQDKLAPYERQLFEMWDDKIQTLCLLPLMSGDQMLGVLKLAQCNEKVFCAAKLKLLKQIAERVSIAVQFSSADTCSSTKASRSGPTPSFNRWFISETSAATSPFGTFWS